ncbi:MAG TPA: LytTR family DNA-binding domain-containing protein [Moheibacter sp.]|nr:LytTR family DNA-binding domain-containing protein [Moheibacter sp.]
MDFLNCIIIDDNKVDRLVALALVKKFSFFNILGTYSSAETAMPTIKSKKIDVIFSDIDMPKINGLELRNLTKEIPICIFITSHSEYAVESFELDVLDYIVKPLKMDRLSQTVARIEKYISVRNKALVFDGNFKQEIISLKEGNNTVDLLVSEILYLEALKDYTLLVTDKNQYCITKGLGKLLSESLFEDFIRVHRSYAVQKQYIGEVSRTSIKLKLSKREIPIGQSFLTEVESILDKL